MYNLFLKNKMVGKKVNYNIHYRIAASTGYIPESLPVYYFFKRNI